MRFRSHEYDSLKKIIEDRGLDYLEFSFVKRRGAVNVIWSRKEKPFTFHRKKETSINAAGEFEQREVYYIGTRNEIRVDTWNEVLTHFEAFLEVQ